MNRTLSAFALPTALASILLVSACGTGSGSPAGGPDTRAPGPSSTSAPATAGATAADHNDADVAFATDMIAHHSQAVQMADMALKQSSTASIKALAGQIKAAQDPEIQTMAGWLKAWGKPVPTPMAGHDMGSMSGSMQGMMSPQEMDALSKGSGAAFDRMWLQMMIKHHTGAVATSKAQLTQGSSPDAKKLAQAIIDGQTKEITQMTGMLADVKG